MDCYKQSQIKGNETLVYKGNEILYRYTRETKYCIGIQGKLNF